MDKWCCNCIHWDFTYDDGDRKFGKCNSENVSEDLRVSEEESYDEDSIFTSECFGCVWWENEEKVVTKIRESKK